MPSVIRVLRQHAAVFLTLVAVVLVLALPDVQREGAEPIAAYQGRIVEVLDRATLVAPDPEAPEPDAPEPAGPRGDVRVLLLDGPTAGDTIEAFLGGPSTAVESDDYAVGDEVVVTFRGDPSGVPFVSVSDRWRLPVLGVLGALFIAAVALVGRGRGVRALVALALTIALVIKVLVPQVLLGVPPIPLALFIAAAVTVVTIGLTEGLGRTSLAAIAGTIAALALTGVLAAIFGELARFSAAAGEELVFLQVSGEPFDVRGLLLAAFVLGALGVLDDVTVTQAATVEELAARAGLRGRELYMSALRVGRSHIAATVNTLFMAYVGASLPLLVLFALAGQPGAMTLNSEIVAIEVVRTLVGSLGIVAAVPLTTLIATWLAGRADDPEQPYEAADRSHGQTLIGHGGWPPG